MKSPHKALKIILIVIVVIAILWGSFAIIPPKKAIEENPFIIEEGSRPLIAAHRGGKNLNPENTFKAFNYSIENFDIDILELDLCMTKDERLVVVHNLTINECSDVEEITGSSDDYFVSDHTLSELELFNYGYNFKNEVGEYVYRNLLTGVADADKASILAENDLKIVTIDELFAAYKDTDLKFIIEIKDGGELGYKAADILASQMKENSMEKRVVIGTFHTEIENYLEEKYPSLMRGGSVGGVTKFVVTQMLGVNIFDNSTFCCLQIPVEETVKGITIHLDKKTYINRAHRRNISVQYWTINDKEEMRELINLGADVIMTDSPDILYELLEEMGLNK